MTRAAPSSSLRSRAARSCTTSARPRRSAAGSGSADGCYGPRDNRLELVASLTADVERAQSKNPGRKPGFLRVELVARSVPPAADLVVHAGAEDVVRELGVARRDVQAKASEGRLREGLVVVKLDIEIPALDRPAVTERVLIAGAHRPTGAGIALLMAGAGLIANEEFGR